MNLHLISIDIEDLICENGVTMVSVSASSEWISSRDHGPTSACLDKEEDAISTGSFRGSCPGGIVLFQYFVLGLPNIHFAIL